MTKKMLETKILYNRGLRNLFQGLRRHSLNKNYRCVCNKYSEIEGYLLAGLYTNALTEIEYLKIGKVACQQYQNLADKCFID
jgi:hypothetical protein